MLWPRRSKNFGKVNYLLNNAFSFVSKGPDATREDWLRIFEVGPVAFALMGSLVAPSMKEQGGGAIVNISSISAFIAQPNRWTYNAAKGAVHTLTKCMALDLAPYGVRVNSVSPGWIWTREVLKAAAGDRAKWEPVWGQYHILERLGEPAEVAAAILFLFSDDASFVNAADLAVDGGYASLGPGRVGQDQQVCGFEVGFLSSIVPSFDTRLRLAYHSARNRAELTGLSPSAHVERARHGLSNKKGGTTMSTTTTKIRQYENFIDGEFIKNSSGSTITVINPATEEVISEVPKGTAADIDAAVLAAERAQKTWCKRPAIERAGYLREIGHAIRAE